MDGRMDGMVLNASAQGILGLQVQVFSLQFSGVNNVINSDHIYIYIHTPVN